MSKKNIKAKSVFIAGVAGSIGAKTAEKLLKQGKGVVGVDNLNDYYSVALKQSRLRQLKQYKNFIFHQGDIESLKFLRKLFKKYRFSAVINLAARAGVRYSLENPFIYISTNVTGNLNLLDCCRESGADKFVLASSSSLYAGEKMPFKETLDVNTPISPYAASKEAAEAMCYTYHYLYGMDITILRYFTVYGPADRPDMAVYKFIEGIKNNRPIEVYGDGKSLRDFTYVDDIVDGTVKALKKVGFEVINLGGNRPHTLCELIGLIEKYLGKKAVIKRSPSHKADMKATWADITKAKKILGWQPKVSLEEGIRRTVNWHL